MASFKQLKSSDVITVPLVANKQWNFNYCPLPQNDPNIKVYSGVNLTGAFDPGGDPMTNNQYDRLVYTQINQLFYHQYSGSLPTSSLVTSLFYESASGERPTSSYFNFNDDPAYVGYFPTGSNEEIKVISISTDLYGQRILPGTFQMTSSANYIMYDDGKGNVYDSLSAHIGNIFYSEGIVVITNQNYQGLFSLPPVAYDTTVEVIRSNYGNPVTISIAPLANADLRGNTLINQSIVLFGGAPSIRTGASLGPINTSNFSTGSNNTVSMSFEGSGVGRYQTYYTFLATGSYCVPLISNTGSITVNVIDPGCDFSMSLDNFLPSPSPSLTPSITVSPSVTPSISISPSVTPSISISPSITPSNTPSVTPSVSISVSPGASPSITPSVTPSKTPSITPSVTPSITPSLSPGSSPSETPAETPTPSVTPSLTATPSITPTVTVTPSITPSTSTINYSWVSLYRCPDFVSFETNDIDYSLITGSQRVVAGGVFYVATAGYYGPASPWSYPNVSGASLTGDLLCPP